jgi:hypothetical protein
MDGIENAFSKNTPIVVGVFSDPLLRNGLHNPVVQLLLACMLWALPSNACCLQSHCLATGVDATVCVDLQHGLEFLAD